MCAMIYRETKSGADRLKPAFGVNSTSRVLFVLEKDGHPPCRSLCTPLVMVYNLLLPGKRTRCSERGLQFQIFGRRWQIAMFAFWRSLFFPSPIAFSASPPPSGDGDKKRSGHSTRVCEEEEEEERERIEQKYRSEDIRDSGPVSILDRPSSLFAA